MKRSERVRDAQTSKKIAKKREREPARDERSSSNRQRQASNFIQIYKLIYFIYSFRSFFLQPYQEQHRTSTAFFSSRFGSFRCLLAASFARWGPAEISAVRTLDPLLCSNSSSSSYIWLLFFTTSPICRYVVFFCCFMRIFLPWWRIQYTQKSWNLWNFSEDINRFGNQYLCKRKRNENNSNDRWRSSVNYWNFTAAVDPSKIIFPPILEFFSCCENFIPDRAFANKEDHDEPALLIKQINWEQFNANFPCKVKWCWVKWSRRNAGEIPDVNEIKYCFGPAALLFSVSTSHFQCLFSLRIMTYRWHE